MKVSASAVTPCPGPSDGNRTTVYLVGAADLPRDLLPDIVDHFERHLPEGAELSTEVARKMAVRGAFAKIVFTGIVRTMTEAIRLSQRVKSWFFQRFAPDPVKSAERRRRRARRAAIVETRRRSRRAGRSYCRQQKAFVMAAS